MITTVGANTFWRSTVNSLLSKCIKYSDPEQVLNPTKLLLCITFYLIFTSSPILIVYPLASVILIILLVVNLHNGL